MSQRQKVLRLPTEPPGRPALFAIHLVCKQCAINSGKYYNIGISTRLSQNYLCESEEEKVYDYSSNTLYQLEKEDFGRSTIITFSVVLTAGYYRDCLKRNNLNESEPSEHPIKAFRVRR